VSTASYRFRSMGTDVIVLLPSGRRRDAYRVQRLFVDWDRRMSRFRRDSELSRANAAAGTDVQVSPITAQVITAAIRAARASDGRFDPLLGARMRELGYDRTFAALPGDRNAPHLAAWQPGLWRQIRVDAARSCVRVPRGGELDLGGIAKGMAADAAVAELQAAGVPYALVNAGGDLAVHGAPPESLAGWPVGIDHVDLAAGAALLARGALATSSILGRRWRSGGVTRHHLLDPLTGLPIDGELVQVTVTAGTCGQAEVAAKVAITDTLAGASAFILRHGMTAAVVTRDGEQVRIGRWD
jgi:thiamine biosynthesis lipoprotein